jgi:raffinose/stachyose/melibiose transport system permease protein
MVILKLADTLPGLSLVYAASGLPFTIFLLQGFFRSLPLELFEAAEIDGYNDWMIFTLIALPLVAPGLATAFIIQFLYVWNEFPLALIVISSAEKTTLPVGIYRVVNDMYYSNYARACAGLAISALPVLIIYIIFQQKIIAGMTAGAIKG